MNIAESACNGAVLLFGDNQTQQRWNALATLSTHRAAYPDDIDAVDAAIGPYRRLIVVGGDADLAAVLSRLLRVNRLDIEVAYVPRQRTAATRIYRLPTGRLAARRAWRGSATRVPLIRDETGSVIVGRADWLPVDDQRPLHGEAVVDDIPLFNGDVAGVHITPTLAMPGLRARLRGPRTGINSWHRWFSGRAVQLGSTGVAVVRDGVAARRPARRSTFYRNVEGWLLIR
ncbi:peptidase M50 [Mycobacterium uberis]|uniref:Peptidase M50 n=1 Tax=Mycobacterium uberis TaxID=2162698 RepID=A0A3E1HHN6_9MYCO|nr:peptidase M50 [Mycobacterium uberis]RFD25927.1 peptidase M50 [Mycobacterium uberis]